MQQSANLNSYHMALQMLGTSVLSTVSTIAERRRTSTMRHSHKRRQHSSMDKDLNVVPSEATTPNWQLTGAERVETGRVSLLIKC